MKKIILILFLTFQTVLYSQNKQKDSLPTTWELLKYDGESAFKGLTTTYTQPLKWQKDDFLTAGAIILGTGALYVFDEETNRWFENQEPHIPGIIKDFGWYYGSPQNNYAVNGAIYLYGLFTKNEKVRKTGVLLISAASTAGLIQTIAKTAIGRARPGTREGKGSFKPFSKEGGFHSFPSGHTILSFTTAYAIAKQFKNPFIKAGIYGVGMIAPISRLWAGAHWLTDVGLSMAISILVVDTIDNYLTEERDYGNPYKTKISWKFQIGLGKFGLIGTF
ncbi:phosphatase PAP2 family protein [Mesonia aquimarina]|uniref:phosphatase PAP2 family protein n=1 Tax=Mesonia aquimarina TaxID=1504967 RepID=UPI000EF614E6|nr:phosphatase PAP2 family protein [Mesonia aquimarina]